MSATRSSHGIDVDRAFAIDVDKYCAIRFDDGRPTPSRVLRLVLSDYDFHAVACFRFRQWAGELWSRDKVRGLIPMVCAGLWRRRMAVVHHAKIDRRATIGPGLLIMHRTGLFIGPATIGDNCVMHHNTTIGQRVAPGDLGIPRIGNDVWMGPGVTITGGVTIGDGATISTGAVVSRDVPPRALVAGNPGRVIQADYDNSPMLNYRVHRPPADAAASPATQDPVVADNVRALPVQTGG